MPRGPGQPSVPGQREGVLGIADTTRPIHPGCSSETLELLLAPFLWLQLAGLQPVQRVETVSELVEVQYSVVVMQAEKEVGGIH